MDVIEKFLNEVSWKFDKGYPDITNEQDILMLERLLENEFGVILESTNITDVLHETFFALAFESKINGKEYKIPKDIEELKICLFRTPVSFYDFFCYLITTFCSTSLCSTLRLDSAAAAKTLCWERKEFKELSASLALPSAASYSL